MNSEKTDCIESIVRVLERTTSRTRSIMFARPHDGDAFGALDMAHEDVFVLAAVAVLAPDVTADTRLDFRDDHIRHLRGEPGLAMGLERIEIAHGIGLL